jgi:hypothetical protein
MIYPKGYGHGNYSGQTPKQDHLRPNSSWRGVADPEKKTGDSRDRTGVRGGRVTRRA